MNRLYILYIIGYYVEESGKFIIFSNNELERKFIEKEVGAKTKTSSEYVNQVIIEGVINTGDTIEKINTFTEDDILFMIRYYREVCRVGLRNSIYITPRCEYNYEIIKNLTARMKKLFPQDTIMIYNNESVAIEGAVYKTIKEKL
jgi:hypothetical protein|nr:MAG TPA: hypothetical protein [Caudoviricetes sp.]